MTSKTFSEFMAEMKQFAEFSAAEQRFIRRSLDVAFARRDAVQFWARNGEEETIVRSQADRYRLLNAIREALPDDPAPEAVESAFARLLTVSTYDLREGKLLSFTAYRFLYERLLGAAVRPWLASAFCAAAGSPYLHPSYRTRLLASIHLEDIAAVGWPVREPVFYPEWVEKVPVLA